MKLDESRPADHRLSTVYRIGAGAAGAVLLLAAALGLLDRLPLFATQGQVGWGLSSNDLLSLVALVVGSLLLVGLGVGGSFASTLAMAVGGVFLLGGFVHLALLDTPYNVLAFQMPNVIFSFVVGMGVLTVGMYGRVSGGLPHDNPYRRHRHPERAPSPGPAAAGQGSV